MPGQSPSSRSRHNVVRTLRRSAIRIAIDPVIAVPGYWIATAAGGAWGVFAGRGPLGRRIRREGELLVAGQLPSWAFGRGGTVIGGVFLTSPGLKRTPGLLEHERVHREQWRRYGLAFIPLYLAAGRDPLRNRFEIQAGLVEGGYLPATQAPQSAVSTRAGPRPATQA